MQCQCTWTCCESKMLKPSAFGSSFSSSALLSFSKHLHTISITDSVNTRRRGISTTCPRYPSLMASLSTVSTNQSDTIQKTNLQPQQVSPFSNLFIFSSFQSTSVSSDPDCLCLCVCVCVKIFSHFLISCFFWLTGQISS